MVASQAGEDSPEAKSKRYLAVEDVQKNGVGNIADQMSMKLFAMILAGNFFTSLYFLRTNPCHWCSQGNGGTENLFSVPTNSTLPGNSRSWRCRYTYSG